jgi:hypothetical protein
MSRQAITFSLTTEVQPAFKIELCNYKDMNRRVQFMTILSTAHRGSAVVLQNVHQAELNVKRGCWGCHSEAVGSAD